MPPARCCRRAARAACTPPTLLRFAATSPTADIANNLLPDWLAPNMITLTGLFALLVAYVVTAVYLPEFEGQLSGGQGLCLPRAQLRGTGRHSKPAQSPACARPARPPCNHDRTSPSSASAAQAPRPAGSTASVAPQRSSTCTWTAWTASRRGAPRPPPRWASFLTTVRRRSTYINLWLTARYELACIISWLTEMHVIVFWHHFGHSRSGHTQSWGVAGLLAAGWALPSGIAARTCAVQEASRRPAG